MDGGDGALTIANAQTGAAPSVVSVKPRVALADDEKALARICDAAEREYKKTGDSKSTEGGKFVKQYRLGHFGARLEGQDDKDDGRVHANLTFAHINVQRAALYAFRPEVQVDPIDGAGASDKLFMPLVQLGLFPDVDAAKRTFADAFEDLIRMGYECTKTHEENKVAMFDVNARGLAFTKESFDPALGFSRSDALKRHELYVDPHSRHRLDQSRYLVHTVVKPFDEFLEFMETKGIHKNFEPNFTLREAPGLEGEMVKGDKEESADKDCFKFQEIWIKDRDRRLVIYRDAVDKKPITREPWLFTLDKDDFPFSGLAFHRQYVQYADAFTELEVVDSLRKAYEKLIRFLDETTNRAMSKQVLHQAGLDPELIDQVKRGKNLAFHAVKGISDGLNNAFYVLDLNSPNDPTIEHAIALKALADEITGLDEILRGGQPAGRKKDPTATEMDIRQDNAQQRTALKTDSLDSFLNDQARHRALIDLSLVSPEIVEKVAGFAAARCWEAYAYYAKADHFLTEYSVKIAAGSTGTRAKREKLDRLERLRQGGHEENQAAAAMQQPPPIDTTHIYLEQARQDDNRNVERFLNQGQGQQGLGAGVQGGGMAPGNAPGQQPQQQPQQQQMPVQAQVPQGPQGPPQATPTTPTGVPIMPTRAA